MSTKHIEPIVVDGYTFPMHSEYFFDLKKIYNESPERTLGGVMVFPSNGKFFVPYFEVTYKAIKIEDYQQMMAKIQTDEQTVRFYDTFTKEYRVAKFYAQQPTYGSVFARRLNYDYVVDLKIIFSATMTGETSATLAYDLNGLSGTLPEGVSGNIGDEFTTDIGSSVTGIKKWNTSPDGKGVNYTLGGNYALTVPNMTLYAISE